MNLWPWLLLSVLGSSSLEVFAQRKSCPALTLKNGRVRIRGGGRMAYFRCKKKFKRVGHKLAVCLSSGTWSQQKPVCVGRGCPDLGALPDVTVKEMYKGGILQFTCPEGMRREGPQTLMCDGTNWDKQPPRCLYGSSLGCDFEDSGLCGWSQDTNDDFDWTWTSGFTPTSDTGPDADHTTGSGHYIFMESSAPQKFGQVTRLISPPYQPPPEPMCVEFYYHMKGPPKKLEVGDLEVMIRSGSREAPVDTVLFHREGYQAEDWVYGMVSIPEQSDVFRIVFAATRRQGWSGDIALDDIRILNCSDVAANTTTTSTTVSTAAIVTTQPTTTTTTTSPPTTTTTTPPPTTTTTTTTITSTTTTTTFPTTTTTFTPSTSSSTTTTPTTSTTMTTQTTGTSSASTTDSSTSSSTMSSTSFTSSSTSSSSSTTMGPPSSGKPSPTTTTSMYRTSRMPTKTSSPPTAENSTTLSGQTASSSSSLPFASSSPFFPWNNATASSFSFSSSGVFHGLSTSTRPTPGKEDMAKDVNDTDISGPITTTPPSSSSNINDTDAEEGAQAGKSGRSKTGSDGGGGGGVSDYLPLIVGVSLGLAVGMAVVGVLAWLWARNRRKQKEIQIEEDQLNIIGSIDGNSYSYPPSGSEH